MKKRLVSASILVVYIAFLIKIIVFKDVPAIKIGMMVLDFGGANPDHPANLVPFATILPYMLGKDGLIIAAINLIGNIVLLIPIGFLVPFVWRNISWKKILIVAVASGLSIELLQVVLHVGIFDIDDVLLNALGVMIGYWIFLLFARMLRTMQVKNIIIVLGAVCVAAAAALYGVIHYYHIQFVASQKHTVGFEQSPSSDVENGEGQSNDPCGGTGGIGQIVSVATDTIAIQRKDGTNLIDTHTHQAVIQTSAGTGSVADLKTGERVTLVGDVNPNGSFTARTIVVCAISNPSWVRTYTSSALGISFQYDASEAAVKESQNKVYVYANGTDPLQGQHVERFEKLPNETLEQSIRRQILMNYSKSTCTVDISQTNKYQGGYMQARISYPETADPNKPLWANAALCNEAYDMTNGLRFFLYNTNHPDRFYFFDIGQYPLIAAGDKAWQDTVLIQ